jgi:hypothetical protein
MQPRGVMHSRVGSAIRRDKLVGAQFIDARNSNIPLQTRELFESLHKVRS